MDNFDLTKYLAAGEGETDVKKALALSDRIEGFFQSLN